MAGIIEEYQASMVNAFSAKGINGLKEMIINNRNSWKSIPVRIAVTGSSGVGKSSFINTFRGLKSNAPGAAAVGITETTMQVKAYPHPQNKNLVLYDLPGVGTKLFPRESYLDKIDFNKYDFFIIMAATRFTENDAWLGQQVKEQQKKFFFVRSKIDIDIENERDDTGDEFNLDISLRKIRTDAECKLQGLNTNVYLITNKLKQINQFDFNRLMHDVIKETPNLKRESLVLFLPALTRNVILEKEKVLIERVSAIAIASGIAGAIPVPGLGALVDGTMILNEAMFYREQFNLDEKSLNDFETQYALNINKLDLFTRSVVFTAAGILKSHAIEMVSEVGKNALKVVVPGFGSIIAGILSYESTSALLQELLNKMKEDALKVNGEIAKQLAETI